MSQNLPHLVSTQFLSLQQIHQLFETAEQWVGPQGQLLHPPALLKNKTIANLFFENSTRTRCSFELAGKRLGAHVLNFDVGTSSTQKGEMLLDTIDNLLAMGVDLFVIRHPENGAPALVADHLKQRAAVINAGDGSNEHPTQALLDAFTIRFHGLKFDQLKIAIVGDIKHSRVANSNIQLLTTLGVPDIRLVGPAALLPTHLNAPNISLHHDLKSGIAQADVVMVLRIQRERMEQAAIPNTTEYFQQFGLTTDMLHHANPNAIVMHPGPMNRNVEIASQVADGPQSVILQQVSFGVVMRMAVMSEGVKR